jgi:hypothetical protein
MKCIFSFRTDPVNKILAKLILEMAKENYKFAHFLLQYFFSGAFTDFNFLVPILFIARFKIIMLKICTVYVSTEKIRNFFTSVRKIAVYLKQMCLALTWFHILEFRHNVNFFLFHIL